jgi:hypothetical protein
MLIAVRLPAIFLAGSSGQLVYPPCFIFGRERLVRRHAIFVKHRGDNSIDYSITFECSEYGQAKGLAN